METQTLASILLGLAALAVALVLVTGVITFMRGGAVDRRASLKLMNMRVAAQAVTLVLLAVAILLLR